MQNEVNEIKIRIQYWKDRLEIYNDDTKLQKERVLEELNKLLEIIEEAQQLDRIRTKVWQHEVAREWRRLCE